MNFIKTERLFLVPVSEKHCTEEYCGWLNDPEVNEYLSTGSFPYTLEELSAFIKNYSSAKNVLFLAIHLQENGKHIGNIKIEPIDFIHRTAEYGILIGDKASWQKGYSKEASVAVFKHCFNILNIRKITLGVIEDNKNAVLLYNKLGFDTEGIYKKHLYCNGKYRNVLRMALFNPALKENDDQ